MATKHDASLGMAFLNPPPSNDNNCTLIFCDSVQSILDSHLFAFPLPESISIPEWPPSRPLIDISKHLLPFIIGSEV